MTLANPVNAVLGKQTVHTYTIIDSSPPPSVTFASPGQEVKENGGSAVATVQLSAESGKDVTVPFTISGTAVDGKNYRVMTPSPLTIKAGTTTGEITLAAMDNNLYEDNKTIIVTMGTPVNATLGAQTTHTETVVEDDPPPSIDFLLKDSRGKEGKGPAKIEVSLNHVSGRRATVEYAVTGGTAVNDKNYILRSGTLVFKAGEKVKRIEIAIIDDKLYDDNKTIEVMLLNPVNAVLGRQTLHTHTIIENDPAPAVSFVLKSSGGKESMRRSRLAVSLSTASGKRVTVKYAVTGGTAVNGRDYILEGGTVIFEPGETVKNIDIGIINTQTYRDNRTIKVSLSNPVNAKLGKIIAHTYTMMSNAPATAKAAGDLAPAVGFIMEGSEGEEGKSPAKISVSLDQAGEKPVTVAYAATGGTAANGKDYTLKDGTLVFEPGETVKNIDIGIIDSKVYHDNRTIEVTLANPVNAVLGKQTVHTYTIIDSSPPPSVTFASPGQEVQENGGSAVATVQLSAVSGKDVTVPFTISGTAVDGKNYRVMTPSPLTIKAGTTTGEITLAVMDNDLYEDNKTVFVTLGVPVNATTGKDQVHAVTIVENDPPPAVGFVLKDSGGEESITSARLEVSLGAASGKPATVAYAATGGTAANGRDYTLKDGTLVFEPGETVKNIDIGIIDSKVYHDNRTIEVTLANPVNAVLGKQTVHTYTIIDNSPPPSVTFTSPGQEVQENGGSAVATVQLSAVSGKDVTVPFTISGTAVDGKNYRVMTPSPLTIKAGTTTGEITLAVMDNDLYEDNKTVFVTLGVPVNATTGKDQVHAVTIVENDPPPAVGFVLKDSGGEESITSARLEVMLGAASGKPTTVAYAATGGTAANGKDYTLKDGTLVFEPGETLKNIDIGIIDSKVYHDNRTIEVTLANPVNAVLGKQTVHTYTIIDNSPPPSLTFASPGQEVQENGGSAVATVQLSAVSGKDVTVPYTVSGTAQEAVGYTITPGPLVIKAGETSGTITIKPMR